MFLFHLLFGGSSGFGNEVCQRRSKFSSFNPRHWRKREILCFWRFCWLVRTVNLSCGVVYNYWSGSHLAGKLTSLWNMSFHSLCIGMADTVLQIILGLEISSLLIASWLTIKASPWFEAPGWGLRSRCQWELQKAPQIRDIQCSIKQILLLLFELAGDTMPHFCNQSDYPSQFSAPPFNALQRKMGADAAAKCSECGLQQFLKSFGLSLLTTIWTSTTMIGSAF